MSSADAQTQHPPIVSVEDRINVSPPLAQEDISELFLQLRHLINEMIYLAIRIVENKVIPFIRSYVEILDPHPQAAIIIGTPIIIAVISVFVLSIFLLLFGAVLNLLIGIIFITVGGLVSMTIKLFVVLLAAHHLGKFMTGLNAAASFKWMVFKNTAKIGINIVQLAYQLLNALVRAVNANVQDILAMQGHDTNLPVASDTSISSSTGSSGRLDRLETIAGEKEYVEIDRPPHGSHGETVVIDTITNPNQEETSAHRSLKQRISFIATEDK